MAAVAAGLAVVLYVVALALIVVTPAPSPAAGGAAMLEHVAANRVVYGIKQALWVTPSLM